MAKFTLDKAKRLLGDDLPDTQEFDRLEYYYGKTEKEHRNAVFRQFFCGASIEYLVDLKLKLLRIDKAALSHQSINGHRTWIIRKSRRTTIRFVNLRLRIDNALSKKKANHLLRKRFDPDSRASDGGYSTMSKNTKSEKLDQEIKNPALSRYINC